MKTLITLVLLTLLASACNFTTENTTEQKQSELEFIKEIEYQIKTDDIEIFEDGIIPWISISNPSSDIENLIDKNEIVLASTEALLVIDYPLTNATEIKLTTLNPLGFSKKELIQLISIEYNRIYEEEEESAHQKTIPLEEREGLINRNKTDGNYGIWGHDIGDLDLSIIAVHKTPDDLFVLQLYVES